MQDYSPWKRDRCLFCVEHNISPMMTSWHGDAFRIIVPLRGESTGTNVFPTPWDSSAFMFSLLLVGTSCWTNSRLSRWFETFNAHVTHRNAACMLIIDKCDLAAIQVFLSPQWRSTSRTACYIASRVQTGLSTKSKNISNEIWYLYSDCILNFC